MIILDTITQYENTMKILSCDLCEATAEGETFEGWMKALMPHYQQAHPEIMEQHKNDPEAAKAGQEKWMTDNKARWDAA